jgi:hypothetical protein
LIARLKRRAGRAKRRVVGVLHQLHVDAGGDQRATTFLAGSGRGGTTWIAELINHANEYRFMFEPFTARHVSEVKAFRNRQYLRPNDDDPAFVAPARAIVEGRIRNRWVDYYNHRFVARHRLIKDIRANMFLKWLDVHFPGMRIALLLRHPLAVAASRLRHTWSNDLADFLRQEALMADHLEPHRHLLETVRDPFEQHVLQWCIENWIPLRQFQRGELHLAFYEHFSVDPRGEIGRLFAFLGKPFSEKILERVERPSRMAWAAKGVVSALGDPDSWRPYVSPGEISRSLDILAQFGFESVYSASSLPNRDAAESLFKTQPIGLKA